MQPKRFILANLFCLPILFILYALIQGWSADWMPQDPPLPFRWALVMWLIRFALWPFLIYALIFQHDPSGLASGILLLVTGVFWGFVVELIFMALAKKRTELKEIKTD